MDFLILRINEVAVIEGNVGPLADLSTLLKMVGSATFQGVFRLMLIAAATKAPEDNRMRPSWCGTTTTPTIRRKAGSKTKVADIFMGAARRWWSGSHGIQMVGNDLNWLPGLW